MYYLKIRVVVNSIMWWQIQLFVPQKATYKHNHNDNDFDLHFKRHLQDFAYSYELMGLSCLLCDLKCNYASDH